VNQIKIVRAYPAGKKKGSEFPCRPKKGARGGGNDSAQGKEGFSRTTVGRESRDEKGSRVTANIPKGEKKRGGENGLSQFDGEKTSVWRGRDVEHLKALSEDDQRVA